MRRFLLGLLVLAVPGVAHAGSCGLDVVPAATLLLPYFEVDLNNPAGRTTTFSIANADDAAALAHVVVWTDMAVPTLAFDVYLTGYDVQTINLRDVFDGTLPRTADDGRDPSDTISPQGEIAQDITFPECAGLLPPAPLAPAFRDNLRRVHQGLSSLSDGKCSALRFTDGVARGYVTIDVARRCSLSSPDDPTYFGPNGVAAADNVLWGDFFYIDPAENFAQGENLVRIQADPDLAGNARTFYRRYVSTPGADLREPLPSTWGTRFQSTDVFDGGTALIAWRDLGLKGESFACNVKPAWFPLDQDALVIFDEQENPDVPQSFPGIPIPQVFPVPFPVAANRAGANSPELPLPFDFGWLFFDLNSSFDPQEDGIRQSWMGAVSSAEGVFSVGLQATPFDSGCTPGVPTPGVFQGSLQEVRR
jgi:hypothetical protein